MTQDDEGTAPPRSVVHGLRRRWKPVKQRTEGDPRRESVRIRLHRCFSWMAAAEEHAGDEGMLDARFLWRWIALNALYSRWDDERRWPSNDRECLRHFTSRIVREDRDGRIESVLGGHRRLMEALVANEFLVRHFWEDPSLEAARDGGGDPTRKLRRALNDGVPARALHLVIDRVYFLRCQIVHGAATFGGTLNRTVVGHADRALELLLPEMATVIIDHAWEGDWDGLCYPPVRAD